MIAEDKEWNVQSLAEVIKKQYAAAWSMLAEAIAAVEDKVLKSGSSEYAVPARLTYHLIETADYHAHPDLATFKWAGRFGVDWEDEDIERLPGRESLLKYLQDVRHKVDRWINSHGDSGLLAPDEHFHQEGMTHLDRALYVLRHTHQHIGELFSILRARDIQRPGWR